MTVTMLRLVVLLTLYSTTVFANWMLLAMPSAAPISLEADPNDYKGECRQLTYLVPRQRELCTLGRNMIKVVSTGAQLGLKECQMQFRSNHWNCSTSFNRLAVQLVDAEDKPRLKLIQPSMSRGVDRRKQPKKTAKADSNRTASISLRDLSRFQSDAPSDDVGDVLGGILKFHTREKAYIHAISAAGVAFAVTKACSNGQLPSCSCDIDVGTRRTAVVTAVAANRRRRDNDQPSGNWEWGGCSDDFGYGTRISEDFVDAHEFERPDVRPLSAAAVGAAQPPDPAPQLMNLHNNEAGRRALRQNVKLMCKCHGVSGSCTTKVCWRRLTDFTKIGRTLYRKFDGAVRVRFSHQRHKLRPAVKGHKKPRKRDLVYLQESPDYCKVDPKRGLFGTAGRRCNLTSYGIDNCKVLCCGRGYKTVTAEKVEDCGCKFVWCCQVQCARCVSKTHEHFCL